MAPAGFALQIRLQIWQNPPLAGFPKSKSGTALVSIDGVRTSRIKINCIKCVAN